MWLWKDFQRLNSPEPVILNRLAAARRVFIFGMLNPPFFVVRRWQALRPFGSALPILPQADDLP